MGVLTACRVCLATGRTTYRLTNTALEGTYEQITKGTLVQEGRPCAVCCLCLSMLRRCHTFIETAQESNNMLDQWYQNQTDLKLTERPMFSFTTRPPELVEITSCGFLVPGAIQESITADNIKKEVDEEIQVKIEIFPNYEGNYQMSKNEEGNDSKKSENDEGNDLKSENYESKDPMSDNDEGNDQLSENDEGKDPMSEHDETQNSKVLAHYDCTTVLQTIIGAESDDNNQVVDVKTNNSNKKRSGNKLFTCEQCDYKTNQKGNLNRHLMRHTDGKPFGCKECCTKCDFTTSNKSNMRMHLMTHTGEKPYECDQCDYKTNWKTYLKRHSRKHTGEKPFSCNHCDYKCSEKRHLRRHLLSHTGEKPFACQYCDYKSGRKDKLTLHVMTHTGEKPFACNKCDYRCIQKNKINRHMRTVHSSSKTCTNN